jgi:hypothetical protein
MDISTSKTAKSKSGVGKFARPATPANKGDAERDRGKNKIVGITIRLTHEQRRLINEQAWAEGVSMAKLLLRTLSQAREAKGMPGLPPGGALAE